jgi:hypothetical protein
VKSIVKTFDIAIIDYTCFETDAPIETKQETKFIQDIKVGGKIK